MTSSQKQPLIRYLDVLAFGGRTQPYKEGRASSEYRRMDVVVEAAH